MTTLLGLGWIFGFFLLVDSTNSDLSQIIRWTFILVNTPQVFILPHILFNYNIFFLEVMFLGVPIIMIYTICMVFDTNLTLGINRCLPISEVHMQIMIG